MTYGSAVLHHREGERIGSVERFPPTDQFFIHNCSTNLLKHVVAPATFHINTERISVDST